MPESNLPDPPYPPSVKREQHRIVYAAVVGGAACLFAAIAGIAVLGIHAGGNNEVAITGLATIGATLAGAFASWFAGGQARRRGDG